jgi:hypothetical protein
LSFSTRYDWLLQITNIAGMFEFTAVQIAELAGATWNAQAKSFESQKGTS